MTEGEKKAASSVATMTFFSVRKIYTFITKETLLGFCAVSKGIPRERNTTLREREQCAVALI